MKHIVLFLAVLAATLAKGAILDGLAAKVDDAVITVADVMDEVNRERSRGESKAANFGEAYSNAVENLVDRRLILAAAARRKLDMQEWLVDNRVREIVKDSFGGDMNRMRESLARAHVAETDWRNQIRDDMIVNGMRYQIVDKDISPSPAEMRREYRVNGEKYVRQASTTVSVILLRPASDGTASVTTRGEEILGRLDEGADFAELARANSADSHAKDGGVWKDVKPEEAFRPEIAAVIAKLKVGEFSRLVNLDGWGFIVRKDAENTARKLTFAEAYDKILAALRKQESDRRYKEWTRRLRKEAFVHIYPMPSDK